MSFEHPSFENPESSEKKQERPEIKKREAEEKERLGRLTEVSEEIRNLKNSLESLEGTPGKIYSPDDPNRPDMRKILDKEFELNSALSPVDATDPVMRTEYEDWKNALESSREATARLKSSLEQRIESLKAKISSLEEEKRELEKSSF